MVVAREKLQVLEQNEFVHNYSKLLIQAWTEKGLVEKLAANPTEVLKEFDIIPPANVKIEIIKERAEADNTNLTTQVQAWEEASETGVLKIYLPNSPQLFQATGSSFDGNEEQLGEEGEEQLGPDASHCCCCCPCSTCT